MYKLLLIFKYVRRKIAPMFAALAVVLCTAMVIIVISVMGGWLDEMRATAKRLTADVSISAGLSGFPHYEELIEEIRKLPQVETATPVVSAFGLAKFNERVHMVEIIGIRPKKLDGVISYFATLYWTKQDLAEAMQRNIADLPPPIKPDDDPQLYGRSLHPPPHWAHEGQSGIVLGIEISPYNRRDDQGKYDVLDSTLARNVTLTVVPLTREGGLLEPESQNFIVANEFKSGFYETDAMRVYVPFDRLQKLLAMDEAEQVDPKTFEPTGQMIPARTSEVFVRGKEGEDLTDLRNAVEETVRGAMRQYPDMKNIWRPDTWEEKHAQLFKAVENEKGLITFLFAIISIVAIVMVATTFSLIVYSKTHDVGVLRALGASRWGIANIFLGYGLTIGVLGSLVGLGLACAIVTHLNEIQDWLFAWFGWRMWDPSIYWFDRIPDRVHPVEAIWIVIGSMISSLLGAVIPAILASRLNPVEALRYE